MGVRGWGVWGVLLKGIYMKVNKITVCAIFRLGLASLLSYPVTDLNAGIFCRIPSLRPRTRS